MYDANGYLSFIIVSSTTLILGGSDVAISTENLVKDNRGDVLRHESTNSIG